MCRIGLLAAIVLGAVLVPNASAADLEPLATLKGHKEAVRSVGFTPDGNVVSTGYKEIHVWDIKDLKDTKDQTFDTFSQQREYKWGTPRLSMCGKFVGIGGTYLSNANFYNCAVRLYKIGDKIEADGELAGGYKDIDVERDTISEVAFSPDSKILAAVHYGGPTNKLQYILSLHDLETRRSLNDSVFTSEVPLKLAYSPDGKLLAAGDAKGKVVLFKANSAKMLGNFDAHMGAINDLAFSPDNKTYATVGDDKAVRLWDLETKGPKKELGSHDEAVLCVAYSKDGKYLATGGRDHNVKIWDAVTGKELATIEAHLNEVTSVAFSPNGKTLATGSADKYVRLWDVAKALKK